MSAEITESDRLDPSASELKLSTGAVVLVERLKTRQFFKLVKILTRGAGPMLFQMDLDFNMSDEEFGGRLLGLVAMSIPEAEDQAVEFIQSMVRPAGIITPPLRVTLSKADEVANQDIWDLHRTTIINPEIEDTLDIVERIIENEASDMRRLGKRLKSMMAIAQKTGQLTPEPPVVTPPAEALPTTSVTEPSTQTESLEASPEPSTS